MRKIKFRGYHTELKKMFSAEELAADQLTLLPTGEFINVSGDSTRISEIYPADKFIPLQYTGLKDKNDKEIYEGDLVTYFNTNHIGEIIFYANSWCIDFITKSREGWCKEIKGDFKCLIIGNIYENPMTVKEAIIRSLTKLYAKDIKPIDEANVF